MPSRVLSRVNRTIAPCSIDEAQRRILAMVPPPRAERVPLAHSLGRVAATAITSSYAQPPFDAAAMDGWAVGGDGAGLYRIVGESRAGRGFERRLERGEAIAISTGAPMPAGDARVVRREDAKDRGTLVEVAPATRARRDVRAAGSDFAVGTNLLAAGRRIDVLDIARLSAARITTVTVNAAPTLSVIATGDEIARPGESCGPAQIGDALSLPVALRAGQAGARATIQPVAADDPAALNRAIGTSDGDIVVIIGGASGGRHDHARAALGVELIVDGVRMRPGKPFWAGHVGDRLIVGLPGNPVAALAAVELFLMPVLRAWQGAAPVTPGLTVSCGGLVGGEVERVQFARRLGRGTGAAVLGGSDSAALAPIAGADLLLRIPADMDPFAVGAIPLD